MLCKWVMISPVLPQAARLPVGFQRHATATTLAHQSRLCYVSWSALHNIFCRFSCAFPAHYYLNSTERVLGNDVCFKQDAHGNSHLLSFHLACNLRLRACQLGALAPCILGNRNLVSRSTNSVLKVESEELGELLVDQDAREIEGGGRSSQLEIEKQNLQAREDFEALDPEETPNTEPKTVWESEVLIEDVKLLARLRSQYNLVQVLELSRRADHPLAGARVLLLDRPGNIQSVFDPYRILTNAYYDVLASLPPILPPGPIAIYGLGAGTIAHLLCHFWPGVNIHGWELDPAVITVGRKFFCLSELEEESVHMDGSRLGFGYEGSSLEKAYPSARPDARTSSNDYLWKTPFMGIRAVEEEKHELHVFQKGKLSVHIGDALGPEAMVDGGFAGIIVDLFSKGAVLPSLQQTETWERMKERLRPGGRIMVNCGGSCVESESKKDGRITMEETVAALARVFPGELSKRVIRINGDNCIALTGPIPDLRAWMKSLPKPLLRGVFEWETVA